MTVRTPITAVLAVLLTFLVACGDPATEPAPVDPGPGATGPATPGEAAEPGEPARDLAIAPACDELRPAGATGERPPVPATPTPPPHDPGEVGGWADAEAGDDFAGIWFHPPGSGQLHVAFTGDVEGYRAALHERFGPEVEVVEASYSLAELDALAEELAADAAAHDQDGARDRYRPEPGALLWWGRSDSLNRVSLGVVGGDDAALAEVTARYGADRICLEVVEQPPPMDPEGPVRPLAKTEGWREGFRTDAYALAEIAYDVETAERAWRENVPQDLPRVDLDGDPVTDGRYGSLEDVDFSTHALVVWSAGQSSGCPGWLADIDARGAELVVEHGTAGAGACPSDYNPYRMVLAVERDRLPDPGDLPLEATREGRFVSAEVTAYR